MALNHPMSTSGETYSIQIVHFFQLQICKLSFFKKVILSKRDKSNWSPYQFFPQGYIDCSYTGI